MHQTLTLLMAQINPTVGAIQENALKIIRIIETHQAHHDVIIFPELALSGYPPEDLLLRPELYHRVEEALANITQVTQACHVIIGHPSTDKGLHYNSASILFQQQRIALYHKQHLPNYGVFDEQRYFTKGRALPCIFEIKGNRIGLCICEDIWHPGPIEHLITEKVDLVLSINASPFDVTKYAQRLALLTQHAQKGVSIIYVNQVGGQDELLFDGQSLAIDRTGNIKARAQVFIEALQSITISKGHIQGEITPLLDNPALVYQALCCGLRDYIEKNRFPGVILGLSGGIDSALTLAIAVDTLGAARVQAVLMPSRFTHAFSIEDARLQADTLQVKHTTLSIEPAFKSLLKTLQPVFHGLPRDTTEENMQARIRGVLLMALSNKTGALVLTTSNKSESAVGYATLYGDMCGGFSVLKDILKTGVYELAQYRNTITAVIPQRVLERAPTAELAPNQTDQDSLPDYAILDAIITQYMEEQLSIDEIIASGHAASDVRRVINLIKKNEYKRRQSAIGSKISPRAFGRDWRYPVTSKF